MKARGATLVQGVFGWFEQIKLPGFYSREYNKLDIKAKILLSTHLTAQTHIYNRKQALILSLPHPLLGT